MYEFLRRTPQNGCGFFVSSSSLMYSWIWFSIWMAYFFRTRVFARETRDPDIMVARVVLRSLNAKLKKKKIRRWLFGLAD